MNIRSSRNDSLDVVRHLVTVIGPRRATSLAEAQAAAYIDGRLRRAGMRVSADTFSAPIHHGFFYPLLTLIGLTTAVITFWLPIAALLLALGGLALTLSDTLVGPFILAPRRDSQNIVGTQASEKLPRWRVVLLAPLDSPPTISGIHRLTGSHRIAVFGRIAAFTLLTLLAILQLVEPNGIWVYGHILIAAYLCIAALPFPQKVGASPGGAGALAVLLAAAERLTTLRSVELWTVALGATAIGNGGLQNLLHRYPFPQNDTLLLVIDTIETGHLTYASREGVLKQRAADSLLARLAGEVDAKDPVINTEPRPYLTKPSIAAPLYMHGYRALTILTRPHTPQTNQTDDLAMQSIDPQIIERATRFVVSMVQHIESEPISSDIDSGDS